MMRKRASCSLNSGLTLAPAFQTCATWPDTAVQVSTSVFCRAELRTGPATLLGHSPPRLEGEGSSKVTHLFGFHPNTYRPPVLELQYVICKSTDFSHVKAVLLFAK